MTDNTAPPKKETPAQLAARLRERDHRLSAAIAAGTARKRYPHEGKGNR